MKVFDGSKLDITNFESNNYLQINSCGFQNVISDNTVIRRNGRCDFHILLVNSGMCEAMHNNKYYKLDTGNLVIYAPGEIQQYTFKPGTSTLWCHFTGSIVRELLSSCDIKSGVYFLSSNKSILNSYSNMIHCFYHPMRSKYAHVHFFELIYNISDAIKNLSQNDNPDLILPILTYINANYNNQITLDELSKRAGYSKSRFSHIFSEITGTTPIKYLNDIRLKISCEMLSATNNSVTEIALSCGFNDSLYFRRLFKKKYNMTPSEYRLSSGKH